MIIQLNISCEIQDAQKKDPRLLLAGSFVFVLLLRLGLSYRAGLRLLISLYVGFCRFALPSTGICTEV